ncbi:MAG: hypothetical protein ACI8UO_005736 [Verrucomicrobiales bacterium]|jgi:hypothetical protein
MNLHPNQPRLETASDRQLTAPLASEEELRDLAEDIVRHCPSLTQLLLAIGAKDSVNPLQGLN